MDHRRSQCSVATCLVVSAVVSVGGCDPANRASKELARILSSPDESTPQEIAELCETLGEAAAEKTVKAIERATDAEDVNVLIRGLLIYDVDKYLPLALETTARSNSGYIEMVEMLPYYLTPRSREILLQTMEDARGPLLQVATRILALVCDDASSLRLLKRIAQLPDLTLHEELQILPTLGEAAHLNNDASAVEIIRPYVRVGSYLPAVLALVKIPGDAAERLLEETLVDKDLGIGREWAADFRAQRRKMFETPRSVAVAWELQRDDAGG